MRRRKEKETDLHAHPDKVEAPAPEPDIEVLVLAAPAHVHVGEAVDRSELVAGDRGHPPGVLSHEQRVVKPGDGQEVWGSRGAMCSWQRAVCGVQCAVCSVQCVVCSMQPIKVKLPQSSEVQ